MPSVRQIAKNAGVSTATVSRTLNSDAAVSPRTRQRVLAAMRRAGYQPTVGRKNTQVIGLAYPEDPVNAEFGGFDAAVLTGVVRGVADQKFDVAILSIRRDKSPRESYSQFFLRKGVRGVILRSFATTRHIAQAIADDGFPCVVLADRFEGTNINYVYSDSYADSRAAVEHLIHLGHQRIALCVHMVADSDHADRRRAYEDALSGAGLTPDPALTTEIIADISGGASALVRFMSLPQPPTAIFFTDPLATLGALCRAVELGLRVPTDLSIVGFDDTQVRRMTVPNFTAVCQDAQGLGRVAADWLTRRLQGEGDATFQHKLATYVEFNQTTGSPPPRPVRILPDGQRMTSA
ncbi:MAG: LacI family DNA-binding transcriptional regulator [Phycisphaeraceae bacterium]|nr:LacI family DNA-binding transcriptional regulator [Phycisphaeraceae bacterium]